MFDFSKMTDAANKLDEFMVYVKTSIQQILDNQQEILNDLDDIDNRIQMIEEKDEKND